MPFTVGLTVMETAFISATYSMMNGRTIYAPRGGGFPSGGEPNADLHEVITWADQRGVRWAFSLSNAGARYAAYRSSLVDLRDLNWPAIASTDFRLAEVKEGKQAEFLVRDFAPWELFCRIGVGSDAVKERVH